MKHKAQASDFKFADEPFRLVPETGIDGDRIDRERVQQERDRDGNARRELTLFATPPTPTTPTA